jgi:integrase
LHKGTGPATGESLRVRSDNPAPLVQPPMSGDNRDQATLYPSELVALLGALPDKVPTYRRILYACAAYLGMRAGELRNLTAASIDFEHDVQGQREGREQPGPGNPPICPQFARVTRSVACLRHRQDRIRCFM